MGRLALVLVCAWPWVTALGEVVDFGREVQPLLSDRCFKCHGPDVGTREADLRLDLREGLFEVVVPGDPAASELVRRLRHDDPQERMPPLDSGREISAAEIARIEQWVAEGAVWESHWSYASIVRAAPPAVADASWASNPIDAFVLARLEAAGLTPAPEASRSTLMRRLSLDLLGLLPTPAEVDAFVADDSPDAYERVVESLLASPHHGERWGRHWLDQARYADSDGYAPDAAWVSGVSNVTRHPSVQGTLPGHIPVRRLSPAVTTRPDGPSDDRADPSWTGPSRPTSCSAAGPSRGPSLPSPG